MDNAFLAAPRMWRTRLIAGVVGVIVLATVAVLVTRHGSSKRAPALGPAAAASLSTPSSVATAAPVAGAPSEVPAFKLVAGSRRVNGVSVGYPHTLAGAISAANEYATQLGSTLDPARALAIGRAIDDPVSGASLASFAEGPMNSRRSLGLPVSGAVPVGASMSLGPVSYQLHGADRDHVTVLLLGYLTTITASQGMKNLVGVFPCPLTWSGGDWKLGVIADADYSSLRFAPGSTKAAAAGWLPLTA